MRRAESASQEECGESANRTCLRPIPRRKSQSRPFQLRLNHVLMLKKRLSDLWSLPAMFLFVLLLVAPAVAQSVIIHLKNGDRITGRLLSESTNAVTITNFLGSLQIPLNEIARREILPVPAPPPAPAATTNVASSATNIVSSTNVVQAGTAPEVPKKEAKPPLSPANPEATPIASTPSFWKHDLRFGLNMRYADKDSQEFLTIL